MLEALCNSRSLRALHLVQKFLTNVPLVLLRASRRDIRCVGCGVNKPNCSEAPASIAFMWICGGPMCDQSKNYSLYFKKCIQPNSRSPPHGAATRIYYISIYVYNIYILFLKTYISIFVHVRISCFPKQA